MDDTEALTLIQEGIQGNGEALAEYGVKLDEATVKAQAMKMGLGDNIDEMDEATLAQVRLASIIEQSSKVQQAAINQTDGLTNSTKSLNGIWTNFMEDAGGKFTPVIEQFLNTIIEAWPTIEPMLLGLVEMLSEGLSQAMPVIMELGRPFCPSSQTSLARYSKPQYRSSRYSETSRRPFCRHWRASSACWSKPLCRR